MKKMILAALLALPVLAASARADGCGYGSPGCGIGSPGCGCCFPGCWFPSRIEAGAKVYFRVLGPGDYGAGQLGPWYQYWPLEAHFQTPAPLGYPYWPTPMTLPVRPAGVAGPANFQPASFQPSAYGVPAPSYWGQ